MKEKSVNSKDDDLFVDVLEYTFIEWLIRRKIFIAFKTNYEYAVLPCQTFHDALRDHVRRSFCTLGLSPDTLISSAFLFHSTPEGYNFWRKYSVAWQRFYHRLQSKF